MYDEQEDKVQCSVCGEWFFHVTAHASKKHGMFAADYKKRFGLNSSVAVCSKKISAATAKITREANVAGKLHPFVKGDPRISGKPQTKEHIRKRTQTSSNKKKNAQMKNRYGLCNAQIVSRLIIVRDMVGKGTIEELNNTDLCKYDINLYQAMRNKFGSCDQACKALGVGYIGQNRYSDSELISKLREFTLQERRMPTAVDLKSKRLREKHGLSTWETYQAHFGSWRRAKMMAGLEQLVEEVKNV